MSAFTLLALELQTDQWSFDVERREIAPGAWHMEPHTWASLGDGELDPPAELSAGWLVAVVLPVGDDAAEVAGADVLAAPGRVRTLLDLVGLATVSGRSVVPLERVLR